MIDDVDIAKSFDLRNPPEGFVENPFPIYAALREHAPFKRMEDGSLFLSRHKHLSEIYKNNASVSSDKKEEFAPKLGDGLIYEHHTTSLVFNDPPLHSKVRRILQGALTPRSIARVEASLFQLVDRLLDDMSDKGDCDLIEDFAAAIPVEVIGNLLDVPHEERGPLRAWSLDILGALEPVISDEQKRKAENSVGHFLDYLRDLVARRRMEPGDPDTDVLTRLIQHGGGEQGLSEKELLHNCIFLLNAGHETTTNLIGNGLVLLAKYPEIVQEVGHSIEAIKGVVEEVLRLESSNQLGNRLAVEDFEVDGFYIPAGTKITLCLGAANRDPDVFDQPDQFLINRKPNRHLAFGAGQHVCLGMTLARLEGQVAIGGFLRRFPKYGILSDIARSQRIRFRGFTRVPARLRCNS